MQPEESRNLDKDSQEQKTLFSTKESGIEKQGKQIVVKTTTPMGKAIIHQTTSSAMNQKLNNIKVVQKSDIKNQTAAKVGTKVSR